MYEIDGDDDGGISAVVVVSCNVAADDCSYQKVNDALLPRKLSYLVFLLFSAVNRTAVTVKTILWRRARINQSRAYVSGRRRRTVVQKRTFVRVQ